MNTTLRMKIVFRTPASGSLPPPLDPGLVTPRLVEPIAPAVGPARRTGGSTDPREFLAMHKRLKHEQARALRWKRVGLAISLAACGTAGLVIRWAHHREAAAAPGAPAVNSAAGIASSPGIMLAMITPPGPLLDPGPGAAPESAAQAPAVLSESAARCEELFTQRRWREAIDSCAFAFEQSPDARLALRVGHAHWSSGHVEQAGSWATKAVELGTEDADAYVLIGHSEREAGHVKGAMAAYRRYLHSSPHGWHARTVRAALRDLKQKSLASEGQAGVEAPEPSEAPRL